MGQGYVNLGNNQPVSAYAGTALANSNTLTDVSPVPQYTVAKGAFQPGMAIRCHGRLTFSATATPTLLLGIYWGGVAGTKICAIGATTTGNGTNWPIIVDALITCRASALPSSTTIGGSGSVDLGTSLTAVTRIPMDASAFATVSVDSTVAKDITLGAQWGAASASNTLTVQQWVVEFLNF